MTTPESPLASSPHRRYNPLLDEWVLVSPQRLERPWQGQVEKPHPAELPAYDPGCYLCPGNARANGERNPPYATTYVFDNDFPALLPAAPMPGPSSVGAARTDDLFVAEPQSGICRVVCFSPRHDLSLAEMDTAGVRAVVETWTEEVDRLARAGGIGYVQVFENKGAAMGCSNPHPHGQVWASAAVPQVPARKLEMQRRYREGHGRDLLGDYLARELAMGDRIVCRNDAWVAVVPFWAVWPFETLLVPRARRVRLPDLSGPERDSLAGILRSLLRAYDDVFESDFPYSMGWHGAPEPGERSEHWILHAHFYPPLLRSASVKKFLVGYEMLAEPQRDLTPEAAAERLRSLIHSSQP
jgi:UDPglucose--hexose-1-phosphate uridylyltransferase